MSKLSRCAKLMAAAFYVAVSANSAFAEDTEVFFAPASSTDDVIPNVVFILDTSGSMQSTVSGTSKSRLQVMKEVMTDVLDKVSNVNVGLMRYHKGDTSGVNSAEGGPVLFPATYVDAPSDPVVSSYVLAGDDDAFESVETGVSTVTVNTQNLVVGASTTSYVGLRFDKLLVPQGAKILSAHLVFTASADATSPSNISIYGQLSDDAPVFTENPYDISSRLASATTSEVWTPGPWSQGDSVASEDISDVVQQIVDQTNWCGGNAMAFILEGSAARSIYSIEGAIANGSNTNYIPPPKIKIKFANSLPPGANGCTQVERVIPVSNSNDDWERFSNGSESTSSSDLDFYLGNNGSPTEGVGITFRNVNIPQGAQIESAYLSFIPRSSTSGSGEIDIFAVDAADPSPTNRSFIRNNANLGPVNWNLGAWTYNVTVNSADVSSLVQSVVTRGDWAFGNNMAFYLVGKSGTHRARSRNDGASSAPRLHVFYRATYQPGVLTKREELKQVVADLPATGYTPISDTLAEAGLYYRGEKVTYGIDRDNVSSNRPSHIDSFDATGSYYRPAGCTEDNLDAAACAGERIVGNPNYVSPITQSCQTSHIVFLTDGAPTSHHSITNDIYQEWTNGSTCSSAGYGKDCAVKIAGFLNNNDQNPNLPGLQTVTTHTIGFGINLQFLQDMADAGGGQYYTADTKDELVSAISSIVASIVDVNTSFVNSGVSVNQLNRLTHNDELYYSLFSPDASNVWPGNVKRYRLAGGQIVDQNGNPAVDPVTSEFNKTAQSFWSATADGNDTEKGGLAEQLTTSRKVYTFLGDNDLTASSNRVSEANSLITTAMLGATDSSDRSVILKWANGIDTNALPSIQPHRQVGDPLHSQPTLVSYSPGGTKIFVGTNHGYLHQINAETGEEDWAFIPAELLKLLSPIQKRAGGPHGYGLDGSIALYLGDDNKNGVIDTTAGEKAYLYIGQRRGGSAYYAIDISDPDEPKFMFKIDPSRSGYSKLGQTWSTPTVARMNIGGVSNRLVLIFGGGYDDSQDLAGTGPITDTVGNLIYIADAKDGSMLWNSRDNGVQAPSPSSAGPITAMNSVPSQVTAFDLDGDNLVDHIYVSDTKAQIFRFDVDNANQSIVGGRIARLGGSSVSTNRRFYYSPDVALIRLVDESFLSVSIGSGYRAHPLNTQIDDHFFMIKDAGALEDKFDMDVTLADLADVTYLIGDTNNDGVSDAQAEIENTGNRGWYVDFNTTGEKVIERSITFNNAVIFTTYIPPGNTSVCQAKAGSSRVYGLKIVDGTPYLDTNYDGQLSESDRYIDLTGSGIAPAPQVILEGTNEGVKPRLCVGTQCQLDDFLPDIPEGIMGIRWRRNQ